MNNTINIYNSPTFCAKPNAKQARRLTDVSIETVKHEGKKTITKTTDYYSVNGVKVRQTVYEETPPWKYGIYKSHDFDSKGNIVSSFATPYRIDRRPWIVRHASNLFSKNK